MNRNGGPASPESAINGLHRITRPIGPAFLRRNLAVHRPHASFDRACLHPPMIDLVQRE
jgi:hypothetical protein